MKDDYRGFELGPIRPPSEAGSLLLRVTRNCPWNRCTFCGLYKGEKFTIRPVSQVIRDIDTVRHYVDEIERILQEPGGSDQRDLLQLQTRTPDRDRLALHSALHWIRGGMRSVFLQDANSLVVRPDDLVEILGHLRRTFPRIERITSYARSRSVAGISDRDMSRIADAGLNRIHIGMESASDRVLHFVKKGADRQTHITAGKRVKAAGIELSEYFMPGLGGARFSRANALETADAINEIDPDFIRVRTLAIPEKTELFRDVQTGDFSTLGDVEMAEELLLFLESLDGVTSRVQSDHILNLLQEVEGQLPEDRSRITAPLIRFLAMPSEQQLLYIIGRRCGLFSRLEDLEDPSLVSQVEEIRTRHGIGLDNVGTFTADVMRRFI